MSEQITANLRSRDFDRTGAFDARTGFDNIFRDDGWISPKRGVRVVGFFSLCGLAATKSWFSACLRCNDLAALYKEFTRAGLTDQPAAERLATPRQAHGPVPPMFKAFDPDHTLWRSIEATP